ncbi:MAG TPA: hypothetical protein VFD89_05380 [Clostridia bacterium]|nr:hypothetical protein [Clostridia bacterium]
MLCRYIRSARVWSMLVAMGVVTMVFGILYSRGLPQDLHSMNMLMGMFTGIGGAFALVGGIKLVHYKRASADELKLEEIERNDERNIQLIRMAAVTSNNAATILFIMMIFILLWLDYRVPALIVLGALYVQSIAFFAAYRYFKNRI